MQEDRFKTLIVDRLTEIAIKQEIVIFRKKQCSILLILKLIYFLGDAGNIDTVQQATPKQHTRSRKTYAAIKNVAEEIRNLNSKIDDIRKQNQEIQRQKKDTNLLLERIARALENKK